MVAGAAVGVAAVAAAAEPLRLAHAWRTRVPEAVEAERVGVDTATLDVVGEDQDDDTLVVVVGLLGPGTPDPVALREEEVPEGLEEPIVDRVIQEWPADLGALGGLLDRLLDLLNPGVDDVEGVALVAADTVAVSVAAHGALQKAVSLAG